MITNAMRLSQIARKVSRTPNEILIFLESNGIVQYSGSNAKIEPEHETLILNYYQKELDRASEEKNIVNWNPQMDIMERDIKKTGNIDKGKPADSGSDIFQKESGKIELIRAPKMKLKGIKVVGKIDLPELPEKTSTPGIKKKYLSANRLSEKQSLKTSRSTIGKNPKSPTNERKTSYLERQLQEQKKREKERQKRMKKLKEKKRNYYKKNIQTKAEPGFLKKKSKREKIDTLPQNHRKTVPVYKNPIRRFWAWLNGAYDDY
jgi:hypothetical protein